MKELQLVSLYRESVGHIDRKITAYFESNRRHLSKLSVCNTYLVERAYEENRPLFIGIPNNDMINTISASLIALLLSRLLPQVRPFREVNIDSNYAIFDREWIKPFHFDNHMKQYVTIYKDSRGKHITPVNNLESFQNKFELLNIGIDSYHRVSDNHYAQYQQMYENLVQADSKPSLTHSDVAIVVCQIKGLLDDLLVNRMSKAFPYAIVRKGASEASDYSLFAEPLIYFCSDYETADTFIKNHKQNLNCRYLSILHDSNIKPNLSSICQNLVDSLYTQVILIGSECPTLPVYFARWCWTCYDISYLTGSHLVSIERLPCSWDNEFNDSSNLVLSILMGKNGCYVQDDVFRPIYRLFWMMLRNKFQNDFTQDIEDAFIRSKEAFRCEGYDEDDIDEELCDLRGALEVFGANLLKQPSYLDVIFTGIQDEACLVVLDNDIQSLQKYVSSKGYNNVKVIGYKDLLRMIEDSVRPTEYWLSYVPSLYYLGRIISTVAKVRVTLIFSVHPIELVWLESNLGKIMSQNGKQQIEKQWFNAKNEIDPERQITKADAANIIDELMEIYEDSNSEKDQYQTSETNSCKYLLTVTNEQKEEINLELLGSSSIIIYNNCVKLAGHISELVRGDSFRIYNNQEKGVLYEFITKESEQFRYIEEQSLLWKAKLKDYIENGCEYDSQNYTKEMRLKSLATKLSMMRPVYIERIWLREISGVKFPAQGTVMTLCDLLVDYRLIDKTQRNEIVKACNVYNRLMIRIGHSLSSEIHQVVLSAEDSNMSDYIQNYVFNREDNYPLLSIFDSKTTIALVEKNTPTYYVKDIKEAP